jgi:hypothetical protein
LFLYAALGGALFFLPFNLVGVQGYPATAAGARCSRSRSCRPACRAGPAGWSSATARGCHSRPAP